MPLVEITDIPALSPGEASLVDMHSLLNSLSVLRGELQLLGLLLKDDAGLFSRGLRACDDTLESLTDRELALRQAARIAEYEEVVCGEIEAYLAVSKAEPPAHLAVALANIRSVFAILKVRAREILARAAAPDSWEEIYSSAVVREYHEFFSAVEKNAKGRYHVLFNAARQGPSDYYVDLNFEAAEHGGLVMPPVLCDVMRDLLANARKYTPPGGTIIAAMYQEPKWLHLAVADTGRGIPPDEIAAVAQFGKRASNVEDVRTFGGGFGLTKAFLVTKQFGGRFWIQSELGVGTRIRLQIPCR